MVLGFVLGPIFERYLFLSNEIYGARWMMRPVVIAIAILITSGVRGPRSQRSPTNTAFRPSGAVIAGRRSPSASPQATP